MTDTKEFNKSLDRIAKALGGEEWSAEDKPEAMYKLLDKIADVLEERNSESSSSLPFVKVNFEIEDGIVTIEKTYAELVAMIQEGLSPFLYWHGISYFLSNYSEGNVIVFTPTLIYSGTDKAYANDVQVFPNYTVADYYDIAVTAVNPGD